MDQMKRKAYQTEAIPSQISHEKYSGEIVMYFIIRK